MRRVDLFTALLAVAWIFMLILGIDGLRGIRVQHVPGYPARAQIILYAGIPTAVLVVLLVAALLSRTTLWLRHIHFVVAALAAFLLLPTLIVWEGGI